MKVFIKILFALISLVAFLTIYGITFLFAEKHTSLGFCFSALCSIITYMHFNFDDEKTQ
jgi:UDP-N-acetylmuramyl pentapeptide phosphotransferase/UDP-N-acetylglucosamine-1-phosphate transferase